MKNIKFFAAVLTVAVLIMLSGCKKTLSDFLLSSGGNPRAENSSSTAKTDSFKSERKNGENVSDNSDTYEDSSKIETNGEITQNGEDYVEEERHIEPDEYPPESVPEPQKSYREKMIGTWSCIYPPGSLASGTRSAENLYIFNITVNADDNVLITELEYCPASADSTGEEAYYNGKRFVLLNDSSKMNGAFKGRFSAVAGKENIAEIVINDTSPFGDGAAVGETHRLTLVDDNHFQWTSGSAGEGGMYFPFTATTYFVKK